MQEGSTRNLPDRAGRPRLDWSVLAVPVAVSVLAGLPAFLVGTLAVDLRSDLEFSKVALGSLVAIYSGLTAVFAIPAGRIVERIGYRQGLVLSPALAGLSMVLPALLAQRWGHMAAGQVLGALAASFAVPSVQVALATRIPPERQGIAFGLNLASVPAAILIAGAAVPLVGETLGWRWAIGGAGVLGLFVSAAALLSVGREGRPARLPTRVPIQRRLVYLGSGAMFLGVFGAQSVATFAVESGVEDGHTAGSLGFVLALASIVSILVRILGGLGADRSGPVRAFVFIVSVILGGATGMVLLAIGSAFVVVAAGVVLGLGFGWGWNGVLAYGLIRPNPRAAAGTAVWMMIGGFGGSAIGPVATGALVSAFGFGPAWSVSAVAMLGAAVLTILAGKDPRLAHIA